MSDIDRLRDAADRLDRWRERVASSPQYTDMIAHQTSVFEERGATAALLRAVADDAEYDDHSAWRATWDTALVLADTILGAES